MKGGWIVVSVKIPNRNKCVLEKTERIEMRNRLSGPELIIDNASHNFVADGRGRIVPACRVQISSENQGISIRFHVFEEAIHLAPSTFRLAFFLQVSRPNRSV